MVGRWPGVGGREVDVLGESDQVGGDGRCAGGGRAGSRRQAGGAADGGVPPCVLAWEGRTRAGCRMHGRGMGSGVGNGGRREASGRHVGSDATDKNQQRTSSSGRGGRGFGGRGGDAYKPGGSGRGRGRVAHHARAHRQLRGELGLAPHREWGVAGARGTRRAKTHPIAA